MDTITIVRQGTGSAVVRVGIVYAERTGPVAPYYVGSGDNLKEVSKSIAADLMAKSGWQGRIVAERATLDAEGKFFSVTVRRYNS